MRISDWSSDVCSSDLEGTLITFDVLEQKVWFWVIPFSNGRSSLGLVCPKEHLEVIPKEYPAETFRYIISQSEYYRQRFEGIDFLLEPKQIVAYTKASKKLSGDGFSVTCHSHAFQSPGISLYSIFL